MNRGYCIVKPSDHPDQTINRRRSAALANTLKSLMDSGISFHTTRADDGTTRVDWSGKQCRLKQPKQGGHAKGAKVTRDQITKLRIRAEVETRELQDRAYRITRFDRDTTWCEFQAVFAEWVKTEKTPDNWHESLMACIDPDNSNDVWRFRNLKGGSLSDLCWNLSQSPNTPYCGAPMENPSGRSGYYHRSKNVKRMEDWLNSEARRLETVWASEYMTLALESRDADRNYFDELERLCETRDRFRPGAQCESDDMELAVA